MNNSDQLTAEKLRLLSMQDATGYGLYLLGFAEALRIRNYTSEVRQDSNALQAQPQKQPK
ncbi:MAG: hypothetical protein IJZ10_03865 [Thermoguttaceae bacterium]|nr:hypothetical protein [Thermoguttaceae bacterium]